MQNEAVSILIVEVTVHLLSSMWLSFDDNYSHINLKHPRKPEGKTILHDL